jgi:hypothetical protein
MVPYVNIALPHDTLTVPSLTSLPVWLHGVLDLGEGHRLTRCWLRNHKWGVGDGEVNVVIEATWKKGEQADSVCSERFVDIFWYRTAS